MISRLELTQLKLCKLKYSNSLKLWMTSYLRFNNMSLILKKCFPGRINSCLFQLEFNQLMNILSSIMRNFSQGLMMHTNTISPNQHISKTTSTKDINKSTLFLPKTMQAGTVNKLSPQRDNLLPKLQSFLSNKGNLN